MVLDAVLRPTGAGGELSALASRGRVVVGVEEQREMERDGEGNRRKQRQRQRRRLVENET